MTHSRSICLLINTCSILCHMFLPIPANFHALLALAASLSTMYFLTCSIAKVQEAAESPRTTLLRKQIQTENWRMLLNRVLYLKQMQVALALRGMNKKQRPPPEHPLKAGMRKWQSWSSPGMPEEDKNLTNRVKSY